MYMVVRFADFGLTMRLSRDECASGAAPSICIQSSLASGRLAAGYAWITDLHAASGIRIRVRISSLKPSAALRWTWTCSLRRARTDWGAIYNACGMLRAEGPSSDLDGMDSCTAAGEGIGVRLSKYACVYVCHMVR